MRKFSDEEKYNYLVRAQRKDAEEFIESGELEADCLLKKYKQSDIEIPLDIYRACAFFVNKEYKTKFGSIALLFQTKEKLQDTLPELTRENCMDQLCYKFQMYARVLEQG